MVPSDGSFKNCRKPVVGCLSDRSDFRLPRNVPTSVGLQYIQHVKANFAGCIDTATCKICFSILYVFLVKDFEIDLGLFRCLIQNLFGMLSLTIRLKPLYSIGERPFSILCISINAMASISDADQHRFDSPLVLFNCWMYFTHGGLHYGSMCIKMLYY